MHENIYKGRGASGENAKLVAMINEVFSPGSEIGFDFYKLLPKLYKDKHNPAAHNMIVREGDDIKGAVGLFYNNLNVNGTVLRCAGIGNVAVTLDSRSKGYMTDCMNLALDDMIKTGTDIAFLGGQRQRYAYFSFEHGGQVCRFNLSARNLRHAFKTDIKTDFEIVGLNNEDDRRLDEIYALYNARAYRFGREREALYDILCSWRQVPYIILKGNEFKGYLILSDDKSDVSELALADNRDIKDAVLAVLKENSGSDIGISLPLFDRELFSFFADVSEGYCIDNCANMTVLNYRRTLKALLGFKASYTPLCDTECTLLIHGKAGDENIHISVKDNAVAVEKTSREPDIELAHLSAVRLLFGICPPNAAGLPASFFAILPVPFFVAGADNV